MLSKFSELSKKDKINVLIICVCLLIIYLGVIMNPIAKIGKERAKIKALQANSLKIEKLLNEYKAIPESSVPKRTDSLLATAEKITAQANISKNISYIKPFSASRKGLEGAEIKINNISGKEIIDFIDRVQKQQITITKLSIKDNELDGLWTVRLYMEG